jgi:type IV secretory pathway TrbL component
MDLTVVDRAYNSIQGHLNSGFGLLDTMVWAWFGMMVAWSIVLGVIDMASGQNPAGMVGGAFLRLGIFVYLASVWKAVVDGLGNTALAIGLKVSAAVAKPEDIMSPSGIFGIGNAEALRILEAKAALCDSWKACIVTTVDQLFLEFLAIGVWVCFGILMLALIMAALTFKVHGLFSFLFLPFSQVKATAFLTESAISGVIQGVVWLAFIAMVAGFGSLIFSTLEIPDKPDVVTILPAFLVYAFIGVMAWQSRSISQGIVTGTTRIGGEAMTAMARNTLGWMTGGAAMIERIGMGAGIAARNTADAGGAAVHAGRSAYARATGAPPPPPRQRLGPGPSAAGSRTGSRGSAWNLAPTEKQWDAARKRGIDLTGMTRGQASEILERKGGMDPSWYRE